MSAPLFIAAFSAIGATTPEYDWRRETGELRSASVNKGGGSKRTSLSREGSTFLRRWAFANVLGEAWGHESFQH